jgi:predicted DNA binding CopG/RHH family protein
VKVRNKVAKIPKFKDEIKESDFWDTHDSTDYLDSTEEIEIKFIDARPKTLISLRLQAELIEELKVLAGRRGIGYQTLIRMWVMERLDDELWAASQVLTRSRLALRTTDYVVPSVYSQSIKEAMRQAADLGASFIEHFVMPYASTKSFIEQTVENWQEWALGFDNANRMPL